MFYVTHSSADNFLSPIPVSDWLIFFCGNLILHQKIRKNDTEMKMIKTHFFDEKQHKYTKKVYVNIKSHSFF